MPQALRDKFNPYKLVCNLEHLICSRLPNYVELGYGGKPVQCFQPYEFYKTYLDGETDRAMKAFADWYRYRFTELEEWKLDKSVGGMNSSSVHHAVLEAHKAAGSPLGMDDGSFKPELVDLVIEDRVRHRFHLLESMRRHGFLYKKGYPRGMRSRYGDIELRSGHHRVAAALALGIEELSVIIPPFHLTRQETALSQRNGMDEGPDGVSASDWTADEIKQWIGQRYWYQRIPVRPGITTPGNVDSIRRLQDLDLPSLRGKSVLDIGCNTGMYSFECDRLGATRIVGIDHSKERVEQARTLSSIIGSNAEFCNMSLYDARSLGRFDVVLCIAVLHEVPDLMGALQVLKDIAQDTILLEISLWDPPILRSKPIAKLGHSRAGWTMLPTRRLIQDMFGDAFTIKHEGRSVRYDLIRLTRNKSAAGQAL